jgi:hypothetical protein
MQIIVPKIRNFFLHIHKHFLQLHGVKVELNLGALIQILVIVNFPFKNLKTNFYGLIIY